jgi:hypothetical protein
LLLSFDVEYAIRKVCADWKGLIVSGTHQLLMWAKLSAIKLNTEIVLVTSKEDGFEANAGKTTYMFVCLISK